MKTLVIYDNDGQIFKKQTGGYKKPSGLNHIEIELVDNKILESVDPVTQEPVYRDLPKTDFELLREENLLLQGVLAEMYERIENSDINKEVILAELIEMLLGAK